MSPANSTRRAAVIWCAAVLVICAVWLRRWGIEAVLATWLSVVAMTVIGGVLWVTLTDDERREMGVAPRDQFRQAAQTGTGPHAKTSPGTGANAEAGA